jgi:hypothetical protein
MLACDPYVPRAERTEMNRTLRFVKFTSSNGSIITIVNNHINFCYAFRKLTLQVGGVTIDRLLRESVRRSAERFVVANELDRSLSDRIGVA